MKRFLIICVAIIVVGMMAVSCGKDNEELIVGKWRIQSTEGAGQTINDGSGNVPDDTIIYEDNWGYVFNADGTGYSYEISNGTESIISNWTYSVSGDSLLFSWYGWGIEKLTNKKLRLSMRTEMTDVDGNFMRYSYSYLNFKRI